MKPIRVLIVDDAVFMRSMLREILDKMGRFEIVAEASNGVEAIEMYREFRPDLVTMDIVMPEKDGIEATREILEMDPGAAIVICSALGQEALVIESIAAGARDFIVKPFAAEKVLSVLEAVLSAA